MEIEDLAENIPETCSLFENFDSNEEKLTIPNGIYTLDDLKTFAKN